MKYTAFVTIAALGAALIVAPTGARGAQDDSQNARVCGRVNAPSSYIMKLELARPSPDNFIIATSGSEVVETTVNIDGTFCFDNLHPDLHQLQAFGDGFTPYTAVVMPREGETVSVYIR